MAKFVVDGVPVELEDRDVAVVRQAIAKRDADNSAVAEEVAREKKLRQETDAKMKETQEACDSANGRIKVLEKQLADSKLTPAVLDKMVADRAVIVGKARSILGDSFDASGKTDFDIRKAVVGAKLGDAEVAKMSEAEVGGAFMALTKDGVVHDGVGMLAGAIGAGQRATHDAQPGYRGNGFNQPGQRVFVLHNDGTAGADVREKAYRDSMTALTDAWKNPGQLAAKN
jgi:hypothetical protein